MLEKLISHSNDLNKLRNEGYALDIKGNYLIVHDVPYVNSKAEVMKGAVVTDLHLNANKTIKPRDHQVWFTGDFPCDKAGRPIEALRHSSSAQTLYENIVALHRFSCKPKEGYADYYEKMTRYIEIISNPAVSLDPSLTPKTFRPITTQDDDIFNYLDTASSRYGITHLAKKCAMRKVAIIGLGGTGAYVLDMIAKTHVGQIHIFDGDVFIQHNAFRAPGAPDLKTLENQPKKVDYYKSIYEKMRKGIFAHPIYIDDENIDVLGDFDFVFLCVDKAAVRKLAFSYLNHHQIPFIDTGMELEYVEEVQSLIGTCRATLSTQDKFDHLTKYISVGESAADDLYNSNIQVSELNILNAALAVIRWKKYCGFYQDFYQELQTTYSINTHQLTRDETEYCEAQ